MAKLNKKLLLSEIVKQGKKTKDFAAMQNWSKTTLYRKLNGVSEFTLSELKACITWLGIDQQQVNAIFFSP